MINSYNWLQLFLFFIKTLKCIKYWNNCSTFTNNKKNKNKTILIYCLIFTLGNWFKYLYILIWILKIITCDGYNMELI